MDVLFSIFIATYALSGAQFCNLAELPQAQSIEVVRIYVQQMIGRNEWGQGIILKPPVAREWLHRLHLLFVDNYIPISLEQFEVPLYLSY